MPGGNRNGPLEIGPRTGRKAGFCSGYNMPGFENRDIMGFGRFWREKGTRIGKFCRMEKGGRGRRGFAGLSDYIRGFGRGCRKSGRW